MVSTKHWYASTYLLKSIGTLFNLKHSLSFFAFLSITSTLMAGDSPTFFTGSTVLVDTGKISSFAYWDWATVWGGSGVDERPHIKKGTDGSLFLAGESEAAATDLLTTISVYQETNNFVDAIFISRFDTTGSLIYSTFTGMGKGNFIRDFEVYNDTAYVLYDVTESTNLSGQTLDALDADGSGNTSVYTATVIEKFDPTGNLLWSTVIDGDSLDVGYEIEVNSGGVWFYIHTYSDDLPTYNAHQPNLAGGIDYFVGRLDADGAPVFATYYGSPANEVYYGYGLTSLAAHDNGMAIAGTSNSTTGFPVTSDPIAYPSPALPNTVTKFNGDGTLSYSFLYGEGNFKQLIHSMVMDESGNLYIGTYDFELFMPTTPGAFSEGSGSLDVHLARFDCNGNLDWGTFLGGSLFDVLTNVIYKDGKLMVSGSTQSADFPTTSNPLPYTGDGQYDPYVAVFSPDGTPDYVHLFGGGTGYDIIMSSDLENGCVSFLMTQDGTGFPITSDPLSSLDSDNNVIVRLDQDGNIAYSIPIECGLGLSDNGANYANPASRVISHGEKTCYVSIGTNAEFMTTEGAYFYDNIGSTDLYIGCVGPVSCPDTTAYDTTNTVTPDTVMACQQGTVDGFTGTEVSILVKQKK